MNSDICQLRLDLDAFDLAEDRQHKEIMLAFQDLNNRHPF